MKTVEIKGVARKDVGKKSTKELRRNGQVPCVLYGGKDTIHYAVEAKAFQYLVDTPNVYIVKIDIDGKNYQAIMQDIQFHVVSDEIQHVDFLQKKLISQLYLCFFLLKILIFFFLLKELRVVF